VGQQLPPCNTVRVVRSPAKEEILAGRECYRADRTAQQSSLGIRMHANGTKVGAEASFHLTPRCIIQRAPAATLSLNRGLDGSCDFGLISLHSRRSCIPNWTSQSKNRRRALIATGGKDRDLAEIPGMRWLAAAYARCRSTAC
jgi:hypothetical protein